MNITVVLEREKTKKKIRFSGKNIRELLKHLKLNTEAYIVVRNGEVVTEDETMEDKDTIEILSVISGG